MRNSVFGLSIALAIAAPSIAAKPVSWVDAKTGHRILRLSDAPGNYALYFNYNAYTPQGDLMIFQTADGISVADTKTWAVRSLLHRPGAHLLFAGHKTRTAYFSEQAKGGEDAPITIYAADIDTAKVRKIAVVPKGSRIDTLNAD